MSCHVRSRIHVYRVSALSCLLLGLLLLAGTGTIKAGSPAGEPSIGAASAPQAAERTTSAQAPSPDACPTGPLDLPQIIERPNYCVYYSLYDANTNPNGLTIVQATHAADLVATLWSRYVTDFSFLSPTYTGSKLMVWLPTTAPVDCYGYKVDDHIAIMSGCFTIGGQEEHIIAHELFHTVQASYPPDRYKAQRWMYEGSAAFITDNVLATADNWANFNTPGTLAYNHNVDSYLSHPNMNFMLFDGAYDAALFWKYFTEQYGTLPGEPQLGVDALRRVFEANGTKVGIAAVNKALSDLGAGVTFDDVFKRFVVANLAKDLTNLPDGSYNYIDEEQAGNPKQYGPVAVHAASISGASPVKSWNDEKVVPFGASYYRANLGSDCTVVSASFHRDGTSPAFYHVVTQKGSAFDKHVEGSGADWKVSFLNDGLTRASAIAGSLSTTSTVDITLSCAAPSLDVKLPNSVAVAHVQPGTKLLAQVLVTDGSGGPVVAGLDYSLFKADVGGVEAAVVGGGYIQEQYWLVIQAPPGLADGTYDLKVKLQPSGGGAPLASDTNAESVVYSGDGVDNVLVIDRSGSMGYGTQPRLPAAKDAAHFYVDVTRDGDGLAVVPYNHDVAPAPFALASVTPLVRTQAKQYIDGLSADGATSIGDGLQAAVNQHAGSSTGNSICSFVLLSDGMENSSLYWSDVQTAVENSGCPVTAIAFGPESNETLMQEIAGATGGPMLYNDVSVSSVGQAPSLLSVPASQMALDLGNSYEYAQGRTEGRQRLLAGQGDAVPGVVSTHHVWVDDTVSEVVFAIEWYQVPPDYASVTLRLVDPDGTVYDPLTRPYTFEDRPSGHEGWRISDPVPGQWEVRVNAGMDVAGATPYQLLVGGRSSLTLDLLLPDRLRSAYHTGDLVPIYAFLSSDQPVTGAQVKAFITGPDGTPTQLRLYDDGQHGDASAGDGLYANLFTHVNRALAVSPLGEEGSGTPNDEGAYRVRVVATGPGYQREALGSFSVQEGPDADGDRLPDGFESYYGVTDPAADPDRDGLDNYHEYEFGTDPTNGDSDGGGEADGSELEAGQDPLNGEDDQIRRPDSFQALAFNAVVLLVYDVQDDYSGLELFRATDPAGPWDQVTRGLPRTGIYSDTVPNDQTFYYRFRARDGAGHLTADLESGGVTPRLDPFPPDVQMVINGGSPSTRSRQATLTFVPRGDGAPGLPPSLDDVAEMLISNDPFFGGAEWQPFQAEIPWLLDVGPDGVARVYARFRDYAGNESVGTEASILLSHRVYLPLVERSPRAGK